MAQSTTTTMAGILATTVPPIASAIFRTQSELFNAVYAVEAQNARTVQFASQSVPAAVSALTEGNSISSTTGSMAAVSAALVSYPVNYEVSNLLLNTSDIAESQIANFIGGSLARTVDTQIIGQFASFSLTAGAAAATFNADLFLKALAKLQASGYYGTPVAVLHPRHYSLLLKDTVGVAGSAKEIGDRTGMVPKLFGVEIYSSPWISADVNDDAVSALYIKEAAIGLGYANPLMNLTVAPKNSTASHEFLGEAFMKVALINAGAGVAITADTAA